MRHWQAMTPQPGSPEDILALVEPGADLIVAMAAGEPVDALDVLEREHKRLDRVRIHQMHAIRRRGYMDGACGDHLRHVSYFLSDATRESFREGRLDMVPAEFGTVPSILREHTRCSLVIAAASPPGEDGVVTLGTNAEYVASLIGEAPFFLEVNEQMPRTAGAHTMRLADAAGWYRADRPLPAVEPAEPGPEDRRIAELVAERIPDGATLQLGIGRVPAAVCDALGGHKDLGIHSELIGDGVMTLIESGVATGARKSMHRGKAIATFVLASKRMYDWLGGTTPVEMRPVDEVNDPRIIGQQHAMVSVNATTEVDIYGQCASETIAGRYYSASGGQPDFARGALWSPGGEAFVVLRSTTNGGQSRISTSLPQGSVVTTSKNLIDHVVTEWGVASLRGRTLADRARNLIAVAHPEHRDALQRDAREIGLLPDPARISVR